jgi:capsular exopolysaccharide synthesis family protein
VIFSRVEGPPQVLVVTSAVAGEGKSTSAGNLAITMAQQGSRTLLVDADLRRGTLSEVFRVPRNPGLTEVLVLGSDLAATVHEVPLDASARPLHLLTAGVFPPNPAELVGSERMRQLVAALRTRYDVVIFDAPPINLVTDAALLGKFADSTLLVARAGVTSRPALHRAAAQLQGLRVSLAGVVLNDITDAMNDEYGYGYGAYAAVQTG